MKTKLIILFIVLCEVANAQYTKLLEFNGTNGNQSFGSVILSSNNNVLYGMTNGDGPIANSAGTIFSINTNGTGYLNLHTFTGDAISGSHPYGSLVRSGSVLYGMTASGGLYGSGTIFSIHTNGSGYTKLFDFNSDSTSGSNPNGSLIISGNKLYGMTYYGGTYGDGTIFSIDTNGTGYTVLHNFSTQDGYYPNGDLILNGNVLYGMTLYGGVNGVGVVFSVHTDGSGYTKLLNFNNANGSSPIGSLTLSGNVLFGAAGGGTNNKGVLFSIHTDGTGYNKLLDFDGTNGLGPTNLTVSNNLLYGTTSGGGTNDKGTIFSIDTSGSTFHTLYNFDSPNGFAPRAALSFINNTLYGTTVSGGTYNKGVVFSFKTHPSAIPFCMVTVDDSSQFNHIIWDKPISTNIDSFIVYREITTNTYRRIGAIPYSAFTEFIDTCRTLYFPFTGDPNAGTYRYKLQYREISGNYSLLSPYHNTIFITQSGGTFNWNQYSIEGDSVPLPNLTSYVLYRDDNSNGNWHAIQGVSGTQTSVTDPNYTSYPNGSWRIETSWNLSCTPSKIYNTSKSNIMSSPNSIETLLSDESVKLFPNPTTGLFSVVTSKSCEYKIEIVNILGNLIYSSIIKEHESIINLDIPSGIYFINLTQENKLIRKDKLIIVN